MNAQDVLNLYWSRSVPAKTPVDPISIARNAGLTVISDNSMQGGFCGQVAMEDGDVVIRYSSSEHNVRQRFTVAHELGHYFLGHMSGVDRDTVFQDGPRQFSASIWHPKEAAANRFAAELLIPMDTLDYYITHRKVLDGHKLATLFGVSTVAVDLRVKEWQKLRSRLLV